MVQLRGVPKEFVKSSGSDEHEENDESSQPTESTSVKPADTSIVGKNPFKKRKVETSFDQGEASQDTIEQVREEAAGIKAFNYSETNEVVTKEKKSKSGSKNMAFSKSEDSLNSVKSNENKFSKIAEMTNEIEVLEDGSETKKKKRKKRDAESTESLSESQSSFKKIEVITIEDESEVAVPKKKKKKAEKIVFDLEDSAEMNAPAKTKMIFTKSEDMLQSVPVVKKPILERSLKPIAVPKEKEKPKHAPIVFDTVDGSTKTNVSSNQISNQETLLNLIEFRAPPFRIRKQNASPLQRVLLVVPFCDMNLSLEHAIIMNALSWGNIPHFFDFQLMGDSVKCVLSIQNMMVSSAVGVSQEAAKKVCTKKAYNKLINTNIVLKREDMNAKESNFEATELISEEPLPVNITNSGALPLGDSLSQSNMGHKLLMKMGWSGAGLGKEQQGRVEPVAAVANVRRAGLTDEISRKSVNGLRLTKETAQKLLEDYAYSGSDEPIVFSAEFNNAERALIHQTAQAMKRRSGINLETKSFGKGEERKLTVAVKYNPEDIFELAKQVGQKFGKLEIISMGVFG